MVLTVKTAETRLFPTEGIGTLLDIVRVSPIIKLRMILGWDINQPLTESFSPLPTVESLNLSSNLPARKPNEVLPHEEILQLQVEFYSYDLSDKDHRKYNHLYDDNEK